MANLLKQLELEELSLVDRPANAQAKVALFKRDNEDDMTQINKMTDGQKEEMDKMSDDMKSKMKMYMEEKGMSYDDAKKATEEDMKKSDLEAEIDTLKAENEKLRKSLLDEGYVIKADAIEKKAEPEYITYDGEQINKADVPAPILKALEEAEMQKADTALTKRAEEELPHFAADVAKKLLVAVDKSDDTEGLMEALKAADKAFADNMEEVGKSGADDDFADAGEKLEAMAKAYQEEHSVSYAKAYATVIKTDEGKALVKDIYKKD